jgi:hypothetical protein
MRPAISLVEPLVALFRQSLDTKAIAMIALIIIIWKR